MDMWPLVLLLVQLCLCSGYEGSGQYAYGDDEDWYSRRYKGTPWCAPIKLKHGDVSCRTPRGEHYKNVMGARCKIRCKRGYEAESSEVVCMASKHWSANYACREIRCPKLNMPPNGGYKCSDGSYFNSRCEFFCSPGYTLKGPKTAVCQHNRAWSAGDGTCVDVDAPVIKCPNLKDKWAEPGKLTARVTWDTPEGVDTADGILTDVILKGKPSKSDFPEGLHKMSYTVFDRAGNKGSCRFSVRVRVRRCGPLFPPDNGYMKCDSDADNYGATCEFKCTGGFELQGSAARVCQYGLTWSGTDTSCAPMNINVGVRTAAALLDQFYEKRRLLIISAPTAANHYYRFQMTNLQHAQCGLDLRHVTVIELVGTYPAQIGRIRHRLLPPGLAMQLRLLLRIPQRSFNMVLVDKQGIDKQRYTFPITSAEIFTTIDTFPIRKDEMVLQQEAGQTCQS
ncbi:sushi repeat-containing protein SRPX [Myripristis murdjan]|uniref:sushi repeat-containing protein SRPX n=1 Tax=Myripristis murdjan TaxID=586833 RepID=UPI00117635A6|nr:sushi repeat-containing protein SRPX [Myripristis murdjan]